MEKGTQQQRQEGERQARQKSSSAQLSSAHSPLQLLDFAASAFVYSCDVLC